MLRSTVEPHAAASQPLRHDLGYSCTRPRSSRTHARCRIIAAAPDSCDGPSTSAASHARDSSWPLWSRRHAAMGGAAMLTVLAGAEQAQAAKAIILRDGTEVSAFEHGMSLAIVALRGSVPAQWAVEFKTSIGKYCGFSLDQRPQLQDIFKELSDTSGKNKRSAGIADVVTLGDSWLAAAVARGLIQPLPAAESQRWYRMLPPRMRQLVRRVPGTGAQDDKGLVYGAPYRWGCTLIAYRRDRLLRRGGSPILDWGDLLQPALQGRLAMMDSPRELLAAAIRSFDTGGAVGLSVNSSAAQLAAAGVSEQMLKERVDAFRRQARLFSSRDHVRSMQANDVWAVVGYSQDLVQLAERSSNVELVAPLSGTQLWADVWAVPSGAQGGHRKASPSPLLPVWFEFTLSPGRITGTPGLKGGAPSVMLTDSDGVAGMASASSPGLSATPVLAAIHEHRRHLLEGRAAAAAAGPLATALGGLRRAVPMLRPFLPDPRERVGAHDDGDDAAQSSSSASPDSAAAAATAALYPPVNLHHDNWYLPPPPVLQRSEFLLPLDEPTLELYRRVLAEDVVAAR